MKLSMLYEDLAHDLMRHSRYLAKASPEEMSRWISVWQNKSREELQQHLADIGEAYGTGQYPEIPGPAGTVTQGKYDTLKYKNALEKHLKWPDIGMGYGI